MAQPVPARLTAAAGRRFAWAVGTAFLALAALLWWRHRLGVALVPAVLGVVFWAGGAVAPGRLDPVYRGWMGLAAALSRVTTPVFLGVVYFGVIAPVGLVMRLAGRNPIRHKPVNGSYWRSRTDSRGTLRNQF